MEQHPDSKDVQVYRTDDQIVDEVSGCQCLYQTAASCISVHSFPRIHGLPLLVGEHDPESYHIDQYALHQRDDMNIPIQLGPGIELRIDAGKEACG